MKPIKCESVDDMKKVYYEVSLVQMDDDCNSSTGWIWETIVRDKQRAHEVGKRMLNDVLRRGADPRCNCFYVRIDRYRRDELDEQFEIDLENDFWFPFYKKNESGEWQKVITK